MQSIFKSVWRCQTTSVNLLVRKLCDYDLQEPLSSRLDDLRRESRNVQRRITRLKKSTFYPKKRIETPVSLYISSRRKSIGSFPPGLGSATNKPDIREMYRDFYADWQSLSTDQKMPFIEKARQNKAENFQELKMWHDINGKLENAAKLTELERTLRDLRRRLKSGSSSK